MARIHIDTNLRWSLCRAMCTTFSFGLGFTWSSPKRFAAPAFEFLQMIAPMRVWGIIFILAAIGLVFGYTSRLRGVMTNSLMIAVGIHTFISLGYLIQALRDGHSSFTGAIAFAAVAASIGGTASAVSRSCRVDR